MQLSEASASRIRRRRGQSAIEVALMSPWIFLLFIALFDFGFYAYAAIATQNAARAAALAAASTPTSAADQAAACSQVKQEMRMLANVAALSGTFACGVLPLTVTATAFNDAEAKAASRVTVTYQTAQLFPLPFLTGRLTLTRIAEMRVYGE